MKNIVLLIFLFIDLFLNSQTIIWTENFNNGCTAACTAVGYNGTNGSWTQTITGTEGADPNAWFVSCAENNQGLGNCGAACGSNQTLHISAAIGNIFCPNDCGAAYDAGGLCGFFACPQTNRRIESPTINLTGQSNVTLGFSYIEQGQGTTDNCTVWYFDGTTWSLLFDTPATNNGTCGGQGLWTAITFPLPASANNNPNVKIGFRWVNNDDGVGTDPSVAIDDVALTVNSATPLPVPSFSVTSPVCQGSTINLNGSSTNSPTSWLWSVSPAGPVISNPTSQNTTINFSTPNTYTLTLSVTNAGGSNSTTQTIFVDAIPTLSVTPNQATICSGASQTLVASGASSYSWSPSTGLNQSTGTSVVATPTANITYTVTGLSATGTCSTTATVPITVSSSINPAVIATSTAVCLGSSTTLNGSGGTTYTWFPDPTLSCLSCQNPVATPTATTTYTLSVSSVSCPTATTSITISVTPSITATASAVSNTICSGGNTTLNAGGGGSYSWLPSASLSCSNCQNPVASPTVNTTYTVTVSSGSCSPASATVLVQVNQPIVAAASATQSSICSGQSTNLTASGGLTYSWSPSADLSCSNCQNPVATPTANTIYTVTVSDGVCAPANATVAITVNSINASATASSTLICSGQSTNLSSSGGGTYSWAPFSTLSCSNCQNPVATPTANTTYTVTVTNGTCTPATATVSILVTSSLTASASALQSSICSGQSTNLVASGGGAYSWSPSASLSCSNCQNPVATPTVNTTYTVTVTNGSCPSANATVFVSVIPATTVAVSASQSTICNGQSTNLTASGGGTYSWLPTTGLSCTNCPNPVATPTASINYTVTVNNNSCPSVSSTVSITVNNCVPPVASFVSSQTLICVGDCISFTSNSLGNPTSLSWQFLGGSASPSSSTTSPATVCFFTPGTYTVQLNVSNSSGSDILSQTIFVAPNPIANIFPAVDTISYGTSAYLLATVGDSIYSWSPASSVSCPTCSLTSVSPLSDTWYYCTITNEYGCSSIDSAFVIVDIVCGEIFIPTAFSPNGDLNNDVLKVRGNCLVSMRFTIYNRWGEKVFESEDPNFGWDGTFGGKAMDTGVFFYQLTAKTADGKTHEKKGDVTLVK